MNTFYIFRRKKLHKWKKSNQLRFILPLKRKENPTEICQFSYQRERILIEMYRQDFYNIFFPDFFLDQMRNESHGILSLLLERISTNISGNELSSNSFYRIYPYDLLSRKRGRREFRNLLKTT